MIADFDTWLDAQTSVLGSVLIDADTWARPVISRTSPEDYTEAYRPVYLAIRDKLAAGEPIDGVTIAHALGDAYRPCIAAMLQATPTAVNCDAYIDIVLEQAGLRRSDEIMEQWGSASTLEERIQLAGQMLQMRPKRNSSRIMSMAQATSDFLDRQFNPERKRHKDPLLTWGLRALDETLVVRTHGYVVIGGYPSDGKTALALGMAVHQSERYKVGFFSFETDSETLTDRIMASQSKLDFARIMKSSLVDQECQQAAQAAGALAKRRLDLIQASGMTAEEIAQTTLEMGYDVIYIDYLQIIRSADPRLNEIQAVSENTRKLQELARRHPVTVVALSQLSRPLQGASRRPGMSSLKNSSQIEQDADTILLLYREKALPANPTREDVEEYETRRALMVGKNRNGRAGFVIDLDFDGSTQTFSSHREQKRQWNTRSNQIRMSELPDTEPVPFEEEVKKT